MTKITRPSLFETSGQLLRAVREMERTPGERIYFGTYPSDPNTTPESPPFKNGWHDAGIAGIIQASFYIDKHRRVWVDGAFDGGELETVIATFPVAYRPGGSVRYACAGITGPTILQVDPNGDLTQVF